MYWQCFLTKGEVSIYKATHRVLSMPMRHSDSDDVYIPAGVEK